MLGHSKGGFITVVDGRAPPESGNLQSSATETAAV